MKNTGKLSTEVVNRRKLMVRQSLVFTFYGKDYISFFTCDNAMGCNTSDYFWTIKIGDIDILSDESVKQNTVKKVKANFSVRKVTPINTVVLARDFLIAPPTLINMSWLQRCFRPQTFN